ncbi:unnamed protein product [Colias eurytheme]|nr:unnamed protein product [Colias eurytheme]
MFTFIPCTGCEGAARGVCRVQAGRVCVDAVRTALGAEMRARKFCICVMFRDIQVTEAIRGRRGQGRVTQKHFVTHSKGNFTPPYETKSMSNCA